MSAVATPRMQRRVPCRSCPRGLTLLELILVLALIVIVLALAVPSLRGTLSNQQLRKSADLLRAAFSRARVKAMRSGQIQAFYFQLGGDEYTTIPWDAADGISPDVGDVSSEETPADPFSGRLPGESTDTMPDGITFFVDTVIVDDRADAIAEDSTTAAPMTEGLDTRWSPPVLFYPDGTTSDACVVLGNEREWTVSVELRGLSGIARVGELQRAEESR